MSLTEYILSAEIMETTIVVDVEELCTRTVASTPTINPATGLDNSTLFPNASPTAFPLNENSFLLK